MISKSTLVLCDTCVIIEAFRTDSWPALVSGYDIVSEFDASYAERMDPGELSLLCFLFSQSAQEMLICSGDEIVFKVLGRHRRSAQGISLEELLQKIGFNKPLRDQFKKDFRENCSGKGFTDSFS